MQNDTTGNSYANAARYTNTAALGIQNNPGTQATQGQQSNFMNSVQAAQINPSNLNSQIGGANTTSSIKTVSPVMSGDTAQKDYAAKQSVFQNLQNQVAQQSDMKARAALQSQADQAQADMQKSEQNMKQQGINIQQTQADTAKSVADAKLAAAQGIMGTPQAAQQTPQTTPQSTQTSQAQSTNQTQSPITPSQNTQNYVSNLQGAQDNRTTALNTFLNTANNMIVGLQQSESALVSATTQQFQNLMNSQTQTNASYTGQIQESSFRNGGEYTPEIAGGMVANAISYGNQKLSEINSKMATTISDLNINFAKEEYTLMNDNFTKLDQNFKDREQTFKDVHDAVAADVKVQQDAIDKKNTSLQTIATDYLKNGGDPATAQQIMKSDSVDAGLAMVGDKLTDVKTSTVKLDNGNTLLVDSQTGKVIKSYGDGSGGTPVVTNPEYSGVLKTILGSGKFTKDQKNLIATAVNNGEDPLTVIKNNAKNIMGQTEATTVTKYETAKSSLQDIQNNLNEFYAKGGSTNIFSGNLEKAINNLGEVKNPELVDLATQIQANLQVYRNAVSGTAFSEQEGKDIASIFPGINKTEGLNKSILEGRMKAFDSTIDGTYKSALGDAYTKLKTLDESGKDTEQKVVTGLNIIKTSNPQIYKAASSMYTTTNPTTGQPYTASDILQAFPELIQK